MPDLISSIDPLSRNVEDMRALDVLLGLGSNLGDRRRTLEDAWSELGATPEIDPIRISRFHETEAVGGPPNQPGFLNAVALIRTSLVPEALLERLQELERRFGRVRIERWGPRTLDLDILLYSDRVIQTPNLVIPHPEMLRRRFVLEPACEIAPEMVHPVVGRTLGEWG